MFKDDLALYNKSLGNLYKAPLKPLEADRYPDWEKFVRPYLKPGMGVLDLGAGDGHYGHIFSTWGCQVTCTDLNPQAVAYIQATYPKIVARLEKFEDLDDQEAYDLVWASVSIHHAPRSLYPEIFSRVHQALKQKGIFYASFQDTYQVGFHEKLGAYLAGLPQTEMEAILADLGLFHLLEVHRTPHLREGKEPWIHYIMRKL